MPLETSVTLRVMWRICELDEKDAEDVASLLERELGRKADRPKIKEWIGKWPALCARNEKEIIAFCYCDRFAPDILEIAHLLVAEKWRDRGIGSQLVANIEQEAYEKGFSALILSNSSEYKIHGKDKKPADNFYRSIGFDLIIRTGQTNVFSKKLSPKK